MTSKECWLQTPCLEAVLNYMLAIKMAEGTTSTHPSFLKLPLPTATYCSSCCNPSRDSIFLPWVGVWMLRTTSADPTRFVTSWRNGSQRRVSARSSTTAFPVKRVSLLRYTLKRVACVSVTPVIVCPTPANDSGQSTCTLCTLDWTTSVGPSYTVTIDINDK